MNKNWILLFFITLLSCVPSNKESVVETDLLISLSTSQLNFIDFPVSIASIELVDEDGVEQRLTSAIKINLANLGKHFHIVGRYKGMPTGNYKKLKVHLKFNKDSDVVFYSKKENKKYTKKLLSPKGKELGTEQDEFVLEVPLITKKSHVEINKSKTHLNIEFNLKNMVAIREGKNDVLLELRPILTVREVSEKGDFRIRGEVIDFSKNKLTIKTRFMGDVDVDASTVKWVKLDSEKLNSITSSKVLKQRIVADITINNERELVANTINLYSNDIRLFKGLVTDLDGDNVTVLGNDYSSASYLNNKNVYLSIPNDVFPIPVKKVTLKSPVSIDISSISLKKKSSKDKILQGPENFEVSSDAGDATLSIAGSDLDNIYFYYSEEADKEIKKSDSNTTTESEVNLSFIGLLAANDVYVEDEEYVLADLSMFGKPLEEGFYHSDVYRRYDAKKDILYFSAETLFNVTTVQQGHYYYFDLIDFNALLEKSDEIRKLSMGDLDLEKMVVSDSNQINFPVLRIGSNGNTLSVIDTEVGFYDSDSDKWDTPCNSVSFEFTNKEGGSPSVVLQYEKGDADDESSETYHFAEFDELTAWLGGLSNTVFMAIMDITGDLTSKKGERACEFKADFLYLMVLDDVRSRQIISDISGEIDAKREGAIFISGVLLGFAVGAAAALAVAMIVDHFKKKSSAKKVASTDMEGSSRVNKDRPLPPLPTSADKERSTSVKKSIYSFTDDNVDFSKAVSSSVGIEESVYEQLRVVDSDAGVYETMKKEEQIYYELEPDAADGDKKFNANQLDSTFEKLDVDAQKRINALDLATDSSKVKVNTSNPIKRTPTTRR